MAFVLTYQTLTQSVLNYCERTDQQFLNQVPEFIMLAQLRIARDLKVLGLRTVIDGFLTIGNRVTPKPTGWLNDSSFSIGTNVPATAGGFKTTLLLQQRSYEWCKCYSPNPDITGTPKYYSSDYNYDFWFFAQTPDQKYPYEAIYYGVPQFIDGTDTVNFMSANMPGVFEYATLLEAVLYLQDDERVATMTDYYEKAKKALSEEDMRRVYDAYSKRGG